ncbi:MAG: hypothetical protein M3Y49_16310 [Actinomycetota bacterium]|nr:hypothetical protein [Actinomycetota bacterium]
MSERPSPARGWQTAWSATPRTAGLLITAAALLAGCSSAHPHLAAPHPYPTDASAVISSLGAVPIPSAGPAESTPSASTGHPALLAIGGPVNVTLPGGSTALVTALGPQQLTTTPIAAGSPPPQTTRAGITLRLTALKGTTTIAATDLSSRDQSGHALRLVPHGPATRTVPPGTTASITVDTTFTSGAAQITWRHHGTVLGVWTFNIELD